ncbi:SDR family NAD(P)-dependent oxidoreductase [Rhizobium sp. NPDC090275]|uniref:SDR family NAD(P)-dependent oxidoreductase n=1 Tax=Rhizobium sp. NPDC090275 TaxID=3364498 RepID=UPI00383AFA5B
MGEFSGRRIMVTGAGSGLGLATANLLSNEGAVVIGVDLHFSDELSDSVCTHTADVCDRAALAEIAAGAAARFGPIEGLAAFAGIEMPGRLDEISIDQWRRVFDINVIGSANAVAALLPDLSNAGKCASVVLCSSQLSLSGGRDCVSYAASKGAINAMTRSLAVDHAASGLRVNAVAPGATQTPMMDRAFTGVSLEAQNAARMRHALGRFGKASETAQAAAFLLSPRSSFITGVVLPVDGGWTAA